MNEPHRSQLAAIYDALKLTSLTEFVFAGERFTAAGAATAPGSSLPAGGLIGELTRVIYVCAYARRFDGTADAARNGLFPDDPQFASRLAQANHSHHEWDLAWNVYGRSADGALSVQKGRRARSVRLGEYTWAANIAAIDAAGIDATGGTVHLPIHHQPARQPGFYVAAGDNLLDELDRSRIRFYFHCTSEVAVGLLAQLSAALNRYEVPFYFKCLAAPQAYDRQDAAVLLIARRYFELVVRVLDALPEPLLAGLRSTVPLFSREILPGVGVAEDPGNGESFGQYRCRLLAESALAAFESGSQDVESRLAATRKRFAADGLKLDRPHLNPGAADFEFASRGCTSAIERSPHGARHEAAAWLASRPIQVGRDDPRNRFLDVAAQIGCRLTRDALWAGDRCNWIGVRWEPTGQTQLAGAAHGAGLLEGTAGIGLFLARLFARSHDAFHEQTALGALRQAAKRAETLDAASLTDFYRGPLGIAYANIEAAAELGSSELHDRSWEVVKWLLPAAAKDSSAAARPCATAATMVGLLHLAQNERRDDLVEVAVQLGDRLLSAAATTDAGDRWPCAASHFEPEAAQRDASIEVARALLELHHVTQEPRFHDRAAAVCERIWRESEWAALRWQLPYCPTPANAFCFAGPAGWQSWLRCCELTPSLAGHPPLEVLLPPALPALDTCSEGHDFSLGTGWAGRCDLLLTAASRVGGGHLRQTAEAIGDCGIRLVAQPRVPWPCPIGTGDETYNLVHGQAGVGHVYLRLHDPNIPSCLIIRHTRR